MWSRAQLKENAKNVLRGSYWKAFLVSLVIGMAGGGSTGGGGGSNFQNRKNMSDVSPELFLLIAGIVVVAICFGILFRVFIGFALEVGGRKYYTNASKQDVSLSYLGYAFKNQAYGKVVLTMLLKSVYIFLWTLLLIIPGIIKTYAYRMVPYILADNPEIGVKRAIELSNAMTMGEKLDIWVLDLSFIGWYLLGVLCLFVGVLFVTPYYDQTNAELYLFLREQALDNGLCTYDELRLENS